MPLHIILTHEQADFDALASLLGAHLLDETAQPVLPRRLNRNVRAFVTLYGLELPFLDPRDLPNEAIQHITLVDTQSMVSLKGMSDNAQIQVVDHHPPRENLPEKWRITTDDTGANTTLFVEWLEERDILLNDIHATLLLLGIYEDTGSLTYSRTTPRDLHAAAFLLEYGASLQIAADFLNHPLSLRQQELYDRLRASVETHAVHGHVIIMACGNAQEMDEELSTIAHKIRDLLDPDALFVLVTIRGGVQLIARSNTEDIDVAQIVGHFGGGGHERAAAAMVKDGELASLRAELLRLLPEHVRPAITVAQIMSREPQLLSPTTSVAEAHLRMSRYGYEGYPVVQKDDEGKSRVVGLLTRRAVDRALAHKLNLPAASLMDAGECTVSPDDSLEHLQRLMTETGWGQIPVIHPQTGNIVGIVTRTDLLKTFSRQPKIPSRHNLASRLENALPPDHLALLKVIALTAAQQHVALYLVGGFVRDLLLDRPSLDFDLVVEGDAISLARALVNQYGGRVTSHRRFGTAKWRIEDFRFLVEDFGLPADSLSKIKNPKFEIDLVSARAEFYTHPTALPTVERGSIKLDLHRRDFTVNTLALRLDGWHYGELHDYWGGFADLRQGVVRVLHSLSFVDDPTRMLRAVRFEQRFNFRIENRTLQLLNEARPLIARLSGDRIRHEINHILAEENVCAMFSRLQELALLTSIHPELLWDEWLRQVLTTLAQTEPPLPWNLKNKSKGLSLRQEVAYLLWLLRPSPPAFRGIVTRLKMPRALVADAQAARNLWQDLPKLREALPSQIVARLEDVPLLSLYAVYLASDDEILRSRLSDFVSRWRYVAPQTTGLDLRARGLPAGPRYRQILDRLRAAWLDGEVATPEQERELLDKLGG